MSDGGLAKLIKLQRPNYGTEESISKVIEGVTGNPLLKQRVQLDRPLFTDWEAHYLARLNDQALCSFGPDMHVFNELTREDTTKLYPQYFADKDKPAREIYDAIKNSAHGRCPFCGGIGFPENLDHYLPKRHFSQFSLLPLNLVPACRDCNMGSKGQSFSTEAAHQPLHPYENTSHFYHEQWIFASYEPEVDNQAPRIIFYVSPPLSWSEADKLRVVNHFNTFDLATRYSIKAAEELPVKIHQYHQLRSAGVSNEQIRVAIFTIPNGQEHFVNHWRYCMYKALFAHDFID